MRPISSPIPTPPLHTPPTHHPTPSRSRSALESSLQGGEEKVRRGIDATPRHWPRGGSRLGSNFGIMPAAGVHHNRRAPPRARSCGEPTSPSTAPGHARAAPHACRAIHRVTSPATLRATRLATYSTTPAPRRSSPNVQRTNWPGRCARCTARPFGGVHCFVEQRAGALDLANGSHSACGAACLRLPMGSVDGPAGGAREGQGSRLLLNGRHLLHVLPLPR